MKIDLKLIIKKFLGFSVGTWASALISFITTPVITWLILPQEFGKYSLYTLSLMIIQITSFLGSDQAFVRMYYEFKEESERRKLLWTALIISFFTLGIISFFIILKAANVNSLITGKAGEQFSLPLLIICGVFLSIMERFVTLVIRMEQNAKLFSLIRFIGALANALCAISLSIFYSKSFYSLIIAFLISKISTILIGIANYAYLWRPVISLPIFLKPILRYGLPLVPSMMITWIFQSMDRIGLRSWSTLTELGIYSAAFKIVAVMNLIQQGFTTFWVPLAYDIYENSRDESEKFFSKAFKYMSLIMIGFGSWVILISPLIFLLLAKSYRSAAQVAPFLVLTPVMYTTSEMTTYGINFVKRTYWHVVIASISAGVNFLGNFYLIPIFGAKGAAISTGISYIVFFLTRTFFGFKYFKFNVNWLLFYINLLLLVSEAAIFTFSNNIPFTFLYGAVSFTFLILINRRESHKLIKFAISFLKDSLKKG